MVNVIPTMTVGKFLNASHENVLQCSSRKLRCSRLRPRQQIIFQFQR